MIRRTTTLITFCCSVFLFYFPAVSVVLIGLLNLRQPRLIKFWFLLWLPIVTLGLILFLLSQETALLSQALLALIVSPFFYLEIKQLKQGFTVLLGLSLLWGTFSIWSTRQALQIPDVSDAEISLQGITTKGLSYKVRSDRQRLVARKGWLLPPNPQDLNFSLSARKLSGLNNLDWHHDPAKIDLSFASAKPPYTVIAPKSESGWISRHYRPLELEQKLNLVFEAKLHESPEIKEWCAKVELLETVESQRVKQLANENICLTDIWQSFTFEREWQISSDQSRITMVLSRFDENKIALRNVKLTQTLGNETLELFAEQQQLNLVLDWRQGQKSIVRQHLAIVELNELWQDLEFEIDVAGQENLTHLRALINIERESTIELRGLSISEAGRQLWIEQRLRLRFLTDHANFAGHGFAAIMLILLSISKTNSRIYSFLVLALGFVLLMLTGSRTAILASLLFVSIILFFQIKFRHTKLILIVLAGLLILLFSFNASRLFQLNLLDDFVQRREIWLAAFQAFRDNVLLGIGQDMFLTLNQTDTFGNPFQHAHNFWLALSSSFGIFGLIASVWITILPIVFVLRKDRIQVWVIIAVFFMNVFDYSLFSSVVFWPIILYLNYVLYTDDRFVTYEKIA